MNASPQSEVEIERLVTWLVATFEVENDVTLDDTAIDRIRADAKRLHAAWALRHGDSCLINLPFLAATQSGPKHLEHHFSPREIARIFDGDAIAPSITEGRSRREAEAREEAAHRAKTLEEDRRATKYFLIGLLILLGLFLTAILEFSHHKHAVEQEHKKEMRH